MNVLLEDRGGKELEPSISGEPRGAGKCHRWGESAQSQGNKRELVWAHTGWVAGPLPEAHMGLGVARGARLGLSQSPVGSELGRAEWTGYKFQKQELVQRGATGGLRTSGMADRIRWMGSLCISRGGGRHAFSPDCPKVCEPLCSGWDGELRGKDRHLSKVTTAWGGVGGSGAVDTLGTVSHRQGHSAKELSLQGWRVDVSEKDLMQREGSPFHPDIPLPGICKHPTHVHKYVGQGCLLQHCW